jgi:uncharacterized protein YbaR (Trm112 family)
VLGIGNLKRILQCRILNSQYPIKDRNSASFCWKFDIVYWVLEIQKKNIQCTILNTQYPIKDRNSIPFVGNSILVLGVGNLKEYPM